MMKSKRVQKEETMQSAAKALDEGHTASPGEGNGLTHKMVSTMKNPKAVKSVAKESAAALSPKDRAEHAAHVVSTLPEKELTAHAAHVVSTLPEKELTAHVADAASKLSKDDLDKLLVHIQALRDKHDKPAE